MCIFGSVGEHVVFDESQWVWMDGEVVPWPEATVHVSCHGLHYGTGVFEGIRCYDTDLGPAVFRLEAHLQRFYASAAVYGMQIPFTKDELTEGVCQLINQNRFSSCYVRPICYYGSKKLKSHAARLSYSSRDPRMAVGQLSR